MVSELIMSVVSGLVRNAIIKGIDAIQRQTFEDIFERTLNEFDRAYFGLSRTDLLDFFRSSEAIECFQRSDAKNDFDFNCLAQILKTYINLPDGKSAESFLEEFLEKFESNAVQCPELQGRVLLMNLKRNNYKLDKILTELPRTQEQNALVQILEEIRQPQVDGKTLTGNFQEDAKFFEKCMKKLNKNPYFDYNVHLIAKDGHPKIELLPKQPLKGSLTIKLNQRDGKILTLEEMLEEAYLKNGSVIINAESIEKFSVYVGDTQLAPFDIRFDRIELTPIPKKPVKLSVPGCHISYTITLHREKEYSPLYVLSNKHQDIPIRFRMEFRSNPTIVAKSSRPASFNIYLELEHMDANEALQAFLFLKAMQEYRTLDIKDVDSGKFILRGKAISMSSSKQIPQELITLLEKLSFIQERTSIRIPFPLTMSYEDISTIKETFIYFRDGEVEKKINSLTLEITSECAKNILEKIGEDGVIGAITYLETELISEFCGVTVPLGSARMSCSSLRIKKPVEEFRNELTNLIGSTMSLELVPGNGKIMLERLER